MFVARYCRGQLSQCGGFTLIEVLITILVSGIGLLAFAMLQSTSIRFTQSANYRTHATNLADALFDQVRANRVAVASYVGTYQASSAQCTAGTKGSVAPAVFMEGWSCRLNDALGQDAIARVTLDSGVMKVQISWNDERWSAGSVKTDFATEATL
jgi:type IV pilus assembly protein PilV